MNSAASRSSAARADFAHPDWLDREAYPFAPRFFSSPAGRMHYVDEGKGPPIVFVHGNPAWSFQFRRSIRSLAPEFRCIAPDHIGFGLSEKPADWNYKPEDHAKNFANFMDHLGLDRMFLVVNDWGGPIALSWALQHPERIAGLVITNTWLWPVRGDFHYEAFSRFMGGPIGRFLIRNFNFFAKHVVAQAFGVRERLTPEIHAHYQRHLASPAERKGSWVFPGEILGASDWLADLWRRRDALADCPASIVWGMRDIAFRPKELQSWVQAFPNARVVRLEDCGHYVSEEKPEILAEELRRLARGEA